MMGISQSPSLAQKSRYRSARPPANGLGLQPSPDVRRRSDVASVIRILWEEFRKED
jgi:hypothetical protein